MTSHLTDTDLRRLRVRAQRIAPAGAAPSLGVAELVRWLCGVQAQEPAAAALAIRVRSSSLRADVERALVEERSVVRTWGPRGTLHLLAADDLAWLQPLLGPIFVAAGRRRRAELGLDDDLYSRASALVRDALASHGPLTRDELVQRLADAGVQLVGQARPHLLARAALEGLICCGPDRGAEPTYILLDDWLGPRWRVRPLPEDAAYAELTRRYLAAYGPATPQDLAAWSGLPQSKIRAAWGRMAGELVELQGASGPLWRLRSAAAPDEPPAPVVRLLPRYDVYLLGYRSRDFALAREYAGRVNAGGGIVHQTILVDGRLVGTWSSSRAKGALVVTLEPFEPLGPEVHAALADDVADLGRFLGLPARLEEGAASQ